MAAKASRAYVDSDIYLNVVKKERPFWADSLKVLTAAERGDLQLQVSTVLQMELSGWRGDWPDGVTHEEAQEKLKGFMSSRGVIIELDGFVIRDAEKLAKEHTLRGADAAHLAMAIRLEADYLFTRDKRLLKVKKVGGLEIIQPTVVWDATTDDQLIDVAYGNETHELEEAERAAAEAEAMAAEAVAEARTDAVVKAKPIETTQAETTRPRPSNGSPGQTGLPCLTPRP